RTRAMPAAPPQSCALLPPLLAVGALTSLALALAALHFSLRRRLPPPRVLKRAAALCLLYTLALALLSLPAPFAPAFSPCAAPRADNNAGAARELGEKDGVGRGNEVGGGGWARGEEKWVDGAGGGGLSRGEEVERRKAEAEGEATGKAGEARAREAGEEREILEGEVNAGVRGEVAGAAAGDVAVDTGSAATTRRTGGSASKGGDSAGGAEVEGAEGGAEGGEGGERGEGAEGREGAEGGEAVRPTSAGTHPPAPHPPSPPPHSTPPLLPPSVPPSLPPPSPSLHPPSPPSSPPSPPSSPPSPPSSPPFSPPPHPVPSSLFPPSSLLPSPTLPNPLSTPLSPPSTSTPLTPHSSPRPATPAPARFFIYRLIGNDMPPLQCAQQLQRNTLYALLHEPPFLEQARRLWVLNHVVNSTALAHLVEAMRAHGVKDEDMLMRPLNLSLIATLDRSLWTTAVTAQNEARNLMLEHARREGAQWVLTFDGNQFLTAEAWRLIVQAADRHEKRGFKVFKVPMYRVHREQSPTWLNASSRFINLRRFAPHLHESQLAFRADAPYRYQPGMAYGQDNKMELLTRVCGSGKFRKKHFRLWQLQAEQAQQQAMLVEQQVEKEGQEGQAGHAGLGKEQEQQGRERAMGMAELPEMNDDDGGEGEGEEEEVEVDKGRCGCHREVGVDAGYQRGKQLVAYECGYSIRLWYFPCAHVDAEKMFLRAHYRAHLREEGRQQLHALIERAIEGAVKGWHNKTMQ
ncbi:unnamed protein product, partial [Closterium sp. NIES-64]